MIARLYISVRQSHYFLAQQVIHHYVNIRSYREVELKAGPGVEGIRVVLVQGVLLFHRQKSLPPDQ